jgi:hypothetical protein
VHGAVAQEGETKRSKREEVLALLDLPSSAQALRKKGVDKQEVKLALRSARKKRIKAKETKEILDASSEAVEKNGRIDNFGSFVKSKLESGLRGRDLAAAIHAEHRARGKGKGKGQDKEKAKKKTKEREKAEGKKEKPDHERKEGKDKEKEHAEEGREKSHGKDRDAKGGRSTDDDASHGRANKEKKKKAK